MARYTLEGRDWIAEVGMAEERRADGSSGPPQPRQGACVGVPAEVWRKKVGVIKAFIHTIMIDIKRIFNVFV
jgi:hypothetical protein